jgi:hypothetical protein
MERSDRAIEAHDRKIQILKRNAGENPRIPFQSQRNYQMDQFAAMQKMERAMKGTEHSRPKENSKPEEIPHKIDIHSMHRGGSVH